MHSESRSSIPLCVHGKLNVATTDRWRAPPPSLPTLHCALSQISPVCEQISVPHPALPPAAYTHTQVLHWVDRRPQRDSPGSKPWGLWAWPCVGVAVCGSSGPVHRAGRCAGRAPAPHTASLCPDAPERTEPHPVSGSAGRDPSLG